MTLRELIKESIIEDCPVKDITSTYLLPNNISSKATLLTREKGVFFGAAIISVLYDELYPNCSYTLSVKDGDFIDVNQPLVAIQGPIQDILLTERVLLNFLQRLSGISTITRAFVDQLNDSSIQVLDTRKTTPGLRDLEKAAVIAGGGYNHRHGLSDMVLIKENHLTGFLEDHTIDELGLLLSKIKQEQPTIKIEIEIETLAQLETIDFSSVDYIMLDNFSREELVTALSIIKRVASHSQIEVSGMVSLDTISDYRGLAIDRISVGKLTHSVTALDLSLLID